MSLSANALCKKTKYRYAEINFTADDEPESGYAGDNGHLDKSSTVAKQVAGSSKDLNFLK